MANPTLIKNYTAEAAIGANRIVKFGATDYNVLQSAAADELLIGVNENLPVEAGERVDVIRAGLASVEFGGAVARGQPVTSDANGKAVAAAAGDSVIGIAETTSIAGDIAPVLLVPVPALS
jgi:hypothetical protein